MRSPRFGEHRAPDYRAFSSESLRIDRSRWLRRPFFTAAATVMGHSGTDPEHGGEHFRWFHASEVGGKKGFQSQSSFRFALKNPHNFPARKYAPKAKKKPEELVSRSSCVPCFHNIAT
jgi:hypothetical protein